MEYNFIAIEGTIGAGKTTLSTRIANAFHTLNLRDDVDVQVV